MPTWITAYTKIIMDTCKVDAKEAGIIEDVIRDESPTLDHLTKSALNRLARKAQKLLEDPELRELYSHSE